MIELRPSRRTGKLWTASDPLPPRDYGLEQRWVEDMCAVVGSSEDERRTSCIRGLEFASGGHAWRHAVELGAKEGHNGAWSSSRAEEQAWVGQWWRPGAACAWHQRRRRLGTSRDLPHRGRRPEVTKRRCREEEIRRERKR